MTVPAIESDKDRRSCGKPRMLSCLTPSFQA
jgi:hypothetical protein